MTRIEREAVVAGSALAFRPCSFEMAKDANHDEHAIRRHLESLKMKLDKFVHARGTRSGGGSAT